MASLNKVVLIGNVGKDPEVKYFETDRGNAKFSLATNEKYKDKNGQIVDSTEWHNIVVWGNQVKVVESYVKKGMQICVEGKIKTRSWSDEAGVKKYITEINAENIILLGKKTEGGSDFQPEAQVKNADANTNQPINDSPADDLPF